MKRCILCNSNEDDEVLYGELLQKDNISVHFNCLFLTTCVVQEVDQDDSVVPHLHGFTLKTIRREAKNVENNFCCFCKKNHANVLCCAMKCRKAFHMVCGVKNNALFQFCGTFRSFCERHGKKLKKKPDSNENCCICLETLKNSIWKYGNINRSNILKSPCCRNGWFHKYCMQKYANTSGYFFKCPLCNDENKFREKLAKLGIFILDRDAEWELESNAYHELMERPYICTAENCQNELGREDMINSALIFCVGCGHKAIHEACLTIGTELYICKECDDIIGSNNLNRRNTEEENENSFLDVETINDEEKSHSAQFIAEESKRELLRKKRSLCFPESSEESDGEIPLAKIAQVLPELPESNSSTVMQGSENEFPILNHSHLRRKQINLITGTPEKDEENKQLNENLEKNNEEDTSNRIARRTRQSKPKNESACSEHKEVENNNNSTGSDDSDEEVKIRLNRKRSACKELHSDCIAKRTRQAQAKRK